jgi:predicted O-methyltransferase YrrM
MNITDDKIDGYISDLFPSHDLVLKRMEEVAREVGFPIIGPQCGRVLMQLAYAANAQRIFEMGSGFGYSAYWFANGMRNGGQIICTDLSEDNRRRAMAHFSGTKFEKMIDFRLGNALEILSQADGPFDIILNDIDKKDYPEAFDLAISKLKPGGIFITDNVLWSGRILDDKPDVATQAILEFNRKLAQSKDVISSVIPIRDGLGIAVKL